MKGKLKIIFFALFIISLFSLSCSNKVLNPNPKTITINSYSDGIYRYSGYDPNGQIPLKIKVENGKLYYSDITDYPSTEATIEGIDAEGNYKISLPRKNIKGTISFSDSQATVTINGQPQQPIFYNKMVWTPENGKYESNLKNGMKCVIESQTGDMGGFYNPMLSFVDENNILIDGPYPFKTYNMNDFNFSYNFRILSGFMGENIIAQGELNSSGNLSITFKDPDLGMFTLNPVNNNINKK